MDTKKVNVTIILLVLVFLCTTIVRYVESTLRFVFMFSAVIFGLASLVPPIVMVKEKDYAWGVGLLATAIIVLTIIMFLL